MLLSFQLLLLSFQLVTRNSFFTISRFLSIFRGFHRSPVVISILESIDEEVVSTKIRRSVIRQCNPKNGLMNFAGLLQYFAKYRSSRPELFCKKGVPRKFAKFTGNHLCQSLFFNKVVGWGLQLLKIDSDTVVFLWILWNY